MDYEEILRNQQYSVANERDRKTLFMVKNVADASIYLKFVHIGLVSTTTKLLSPIVSIICDYAEDIFFGVMMFRSKPCNSCSVNVSEETCDNCGETLLCSKCVVGRCRKCKIRCVNCPLCQYTHLLRCGDCNLSDEYPWNGRHLVTVGEVEDGPVV